MTNFANISLGLKESTKKHPYKRAIVCPAKRDKKGNVLYSQMTFAQLEDQSEN